MATNTQSHPTEVLNQNKYKTSQLKYPSDLEGSVGHYVNFHINVNRFSEFYGENGFSYNQPGYKEYGVVANPEQGNVGNSVTTPFGSFNIGSMVNKRITQTISLYIPDSMSYGQRMDWETSSIYEMGKDMVGVVGSAIEGIRSNNYLKSLRNKAAKNIMQSAAEAEINNTVNTKNNAFSNFMAGGMAQINRAAGVAGWAFNPQLLVLFRGIGFRSFQYDFYFSPRDETEASQVREIIKAFRVHAHPEIESTTGIFYGAPSTFDIEFMHNGTTNKTIQQVSTCALVSYDVDYAPYGWATYTDGMPIQTRLTLRFQEMEIIDKNKILQGY